MKKYIIVKFSLILSVIAHSQLQPEFAHYTWNAMPFNAASTGREEALAFTLSSRIMWTGISGAPRTYNFGMSTPMKNESIAIGALVHYDEIGVSQATGIKLSAAYRIEAGKGKLAMGLNGGIVSYRHKWSELIIIEQDDQSFAMGDQQFALPEFGAGFYYHDKKYYGGLSVPTFSRAEHQGGGKYVARFSGDAIQIHVLGGAKYKLSRSLVYKPSFIYRHGFSRETRRAEITQLLRFNRLFEAGFGYKWNQAWTFILKMEINRQFSVGYAYDHYTGKLNRLDRGTHDITLQYILRFSSTSPGTKLF